MQGVRVLVEGLEARTLLSTTPSPITFGPVINADTRPGVDRTVARPAHGYNVTFAGTAGQNIKVEGGFSTGLQLGVFDPYGQLVA